MTGSGRALAWLGAAALLVVSLMAAPLLLSRASAVACMTVVTHRWESADVASVDEAAVLSRAEAVRRSVDPFHPAPARVPARLDTGGGDVWSSLHVLGLTDGEISHLADVRGVFGLGARLLTGAILVLVLTLVPGPPGTRLARLAAAAGRSLGVGACLAAVLVAFGALAFEPLFVGFHTIFFASGTWVFPADSLLIVTFPERFWALGAAAWAALTVLILGSAWGAAALGAHVRATRGRGGAEG
jgi:hypothetical protein